MVFAIRNTRRVLVHPKGITGKYLGLSLVIADEESMLSGELWVVKLSMEIVNAEYPIQSIKKAVTHGMSSRKRNWSFPTFIHLRKLHNPYLGYLVNDTLTVNVNAKVIRKYFEDYESKKETEFMGLEKKGDRCYLNSLLQTLFHITYFRKAVYHIVPMKKGQVSSIIPLALQRLFYELQYKGDTVSTDVLSICIGWDFNQHEVIELKRILMAKIENKLKATGVECSVKRLFEGHYINYVKCINLEFHTTQVESFIDLQLDVCGCKDIYDSLDKYVKVQKLEGENKYDAGELGFKDAWKSVLFKDFPPILVLHLKRDQYYDPVLKTTVKINNRYELPLQLDLDRDNGCYLSPEADRSVRNVYTLYSVLVHSAGHFGKYYYAYIRPKLADQWYEFNDEVVRKETKEAIEELYGGKEGEKEISYPNAYMLVYIKEEDKEKVMCEVDENDIPEHHRDRIKKSLEKQREKEKVKNLDLYMKIQVATDKDLRNQIGKDIYFGLVDNSKLHTFYVLKQTSLKKVKESLAEGHGIQVGFWRLWICNWNKKNTYHPITPLTESEEEESVEILQKQYASGTELSLYIECNENKDGVLLPLQDIAADDIMIFIKFYDVFKERLQYVGKFFVKEFSIISEIQRNLRDLDNAVAAENLSLYQEVQFHPYIVCDCVDNSSRLVDLQIEDGDILCVQRILSFKERIFLRFPDVKSFLDYKHSKQTVHFRRLESPDQDEFCLELSRKDTYNVLVEKIAVQLGLVDGASKIKVHSGSYYLSNPSYLSDMLPEYNQTSGILYFQVIDTPHSSQRSLKRLEVAIHNQESKKVCMQNVFLPGHCTIADVIKVIKDKCKLCLRNKTAEMRVLDISSNRIQKIFSPTEEIGDINDHSSALRAEEIPAEEKELGPEYMLLPICHSIHHSGKAKAINFRDPFLLAVHEDETLADVKARIKIKLNVQEDEFRKWKFFIVSETTTLQYQLQDSDILFVASQGIKLSTRYYLRIEHLELD